jgi:hypothetical protein
MRMLVADDAARTSIDGERASSNCNSISWLVAGTGTLVVAVCVVAFVTTGSGGVGRDIVQNNTTATSNAATADDTISGIDRRAATVTVVGRTVVGGTAVCGAYMCAATGACVPVDG